ncbi:ADP-ribosylglycohydrolase family protein, partial [Streptomyces sp. TRM76130]|nr:ADP-ribosylglycohydrolase family protein [Streptomyces sp. TRM76130]
IFLAEKWLVTRLHYGHVDPREAGVGNNVNCGAAMYMAPVGLVNAANPAGAYAEALDIAGAHQSSYGRRAAGVLAAAVAAACAPGATPASVVDACLSLAKDGTREAIEKVCETAAR